MVDPGHSVRDRIAAGAVWAAAAAVTAILVWVVGDILYHGAGQVDWELLSETPRDAGRAGGIAPIMVSTGLILTVCMAVAMPISVGTAVVLAELGSIHGAFRRIVRRSLDALAAVPSIVFGLFGNVLFCHVLGLGYSIMSGGLTLACMVLPLATRSVEQAFRAIPQDHRLGAAALGMSRVATIRHVLLPQAVPGLMVGVTLGLGRAIAETAALLFTSGYVDRMPGSLLDSGRALSVHIYELSMNVPGGGVRAYAAAIVLVVILLSVNSVAAVVAHRWQQRRFAV